MLICRENQGCRLGETRPEEPRGAQPAWLARHLVLDPSYLARVRWEEEHIRESLRRATQPSGLAGARAGLQRLLGCRPADSDNDRPAVEPARGRAGRADRGRPALFRHRRPRGPRAELTAAPFWPSGASPGRPSARGPHFRCWARCLFISNMVTFFLPNTGSNLLS